MIDPYERKARVYPALAVGLPCALLGIVIGVTEAAWWSTITGAAVTVAGKLSADLKKGTWASIQRQAGLKGSR